MIRIPADAPAQPKGLSSQDGRGIIIGWGERGEVETNICCQLCPALGTRVQMTESLQEGDSGGWDWNGFGGESRWIRGIFLLLKLSHPEVVLLNST